MTSICRSQYLRLFIFAATIVLSSGCSREAQEPSSPPKRPGGAVPADTTLLATMGGATITHQGDAHNAVPDTAAKILFSEKGGAVAYSEAKEGGSRVFYKGRAQRAYHEIGDIALSRDGRRFAYTGRMNERWFAVVDGKDGPGFDAVGMPKFSPDGLHVVYNAIRSDRAHFVVDGRTLAASEQFPSGWDELFSGDSSRVILIMNSATDAALHRIVISDLVLKNKQTKDIRAILFVYNRSADRIAGIAEAEGKKRVVSFSIDAPERVKEGALFDDIADHQFAPDGSSLVYLGIRGKDRYLVLNEREDLLPEGFGMNEPVARPDMKAAAILIRDEKGFFVHEAFVRARAKPKHYEEAGSLLYSPDSSRIAHVAKQGGRVFLVVNGREGPAFDMVVSPMYSPDGRYLVYRARQDGKRFVVVADADGRTIKIHRTYEQVFPVVFADDGTSVAYGVKDGPQLLWIVDKL
jgi:hypothetical protein